MPKTKTSPSDLTIHVDLSFEALMALFKEIGEGVTKQLDAGTVEERSAAEVETREAVMRTLTEGEQAQIVERRDQIVEMLFAIEERAKRIRRTVQNAEKLARRYESFGKNLEQSVFLGMLNANIEVIEGELHRFKLYKAPNKLEIIDESTIPEEFFVTPEPVRKLDEDKLRAALNEQIPCPNADFLTHSTECPVCHGAKFTYREVPGAYIERDRKRLDVK